MAIVRALREGDSVVYAPDPLLYGEMEVRAIRPDRKIVCRVDPDVPGGSYEIFARSELAPSEVAAAA
jgi:hypothetical protein